MRLTITVEQDGQLVVDRRYGQDVCPNGRGVFSTESLGAGMGLTISWSSREIT